MTSGEVFDVAVDVRRSSPDFGRWAGMRLSAANRRSLWVPPGFAHGFLVLSDVADFVYKARITTIRNRNAPSAGTTRRSASSGLSSPALPHPVGQGRCRRRSCRLGLPAVKVVITGADGQVGRALLEMAPEPSRVKGLSRRDLDITDADAVRASLERERPDWVFNAAAYTAVDRAEADADQAHRVNAVGAALLAGAATAIGCRVLQISTDFVFSGEQSRPYRPTPPPVRSMCTA